MAVILLGKWLLLRGSVNSESALLDIREVAVIGKWLFVEKTKAVSGGSTVLWKYF